MPTWNFSVLDNDARVPSNSPPEHAYLVADNWDDWGFGANFTLSVPNAAGIVEAVGTLKIGKEGMRSNGVTAPTVFTPLENTFTALTAEYMSLGQDPDYYDRLFGRVGRVPGMGLLRALRDLALDLPRLDGLLMEPVVTVALAQRLRVHRPMVESDRHSWTCKELFTLTYRLPNSQTEMTFAVTPESFPPSNVHVLIGSNGSGKTRALRRMGRVGLSGATTRLPHHLPCPDHQHGVRQL